MPYQKFLVDNPKCNRRFHISYDSEGAKQPVVELKCPHCDAVVFRDKDHPKAIIAREENLVTTSTMSPRLARDCQYQDKYPPK